MSNFAAEFGKAFGATAATQVALAHGFARVYVLIMLLALMGAMFTLVYSPLKQIIVGTPKELWPGKMGEIAEDGMPKNAMWIQCTIVSIMIGIVDFHTKNKTKKTGQLPSVTAELLVEIYLQ